MVGTMSIASTAQRLSPRHWFLVGAVASLAGAMALGEGAQMVVGTALSLASLVVAVLGIRRNRPEAAAGWWSLTAGASAFLVGTAVATAYRDGSGLTPLPSPADAFFLAGYALVIIGALILVRHRRANRDGNGILDAVIVAAAFGVVVITYLVYPNLQEPRFGLVGKLLIAGYELADIVLVAIAVRIAMGIERRPTSYYLVAASLSVIIVTNALTTLDGLGSVPGLWVAAVAPLGHVLFAVAAVDPSMARLTDRTETRDLARLTRRRLVMMFAALMVVPVLLVAHIVFGLRMTAVPVLAGGSAAIALLVVARLVDLVRANERAALREHVLRQAGARLVAANGREDIYQAALEGLKMLAGPERLARVSLAIHSGGVLSVVLSAGHRRGEALGAVLPLDRLSGGALSALADRRALALSGVAPLELAPDADERANVLTVPLSSHGELRGTFVVTTPRRLREHAARAIEDLADQVSMALESADLAEDIHQQRQERRFKVLVEHSSDLIGVLDSERLVSFVSPAAIRLLGRAPESLVGRPGLELVHPEDQRKLTALWNSARPSGGAADAAEVRVLHAAGHWRWFEVVVTDAFDEPEVEGLVVHARDVTDRRAAEQRVVQSEARFRSLVQNATDLVMVVDERWELSYLSPSVSRVLGCRAADLLGAPWLSLIERDDAAHAARILGAAGPDEPSIFEVRARTRDETPVHLEVIVSDLRHDPAVAGLVMNARDITERRQSEERWRAFGAEASHQLRTPITGLRLGLENLLDQSSPGRQALEGVLGHVERLESTVEDFLSLASGRVAPADPLDVAAVLGDIDAAWRRHVEAAGRNLDVAVNGPVPVVHASAAAMRQVLGVLVENALRHGEGRIGVVARELAGGLAVEVRDEGRGMVATDGLRRLRHDGYGMGLALARSLTEAEGGRLVIRCAGPSPALAVVLPSAPPPDGADRELD